MSVVFLNDKFMPVEQASISPLDRGFLFGDGVYELIPSYAGKLVGFDGHMQRLANGLSQLDINVPWTAQQWREKIQQLLAQNDTGNWGVYIQVSRGADTRRHHAYPTEVTPTVFMFLSKIPVATSDIAEQIPGIQVVTQQDIRWQRKDIKSTSLLGNVMHFQHGHQQGATDTLLVNDKDEVLEFSTANVFIVKQGQIITPPLDNQLLPGITRQLLIHIVQKYSRFEVVERTVLLQEALEADEIWLTSSSKEVMPVVTVDGRSVGDGKPGPVWKDVIALYAQHKFEG